MIRFFPAFEGKSRAGEEVEELTTVSKQRQK